MPQLSFRTPLLDMLTVTEEDGAVVSIDWGWARDQAETPLLLQAQAQIEEYLDGARQVFDLPLAPHGTAYRRRAWDAMCAIPYGETRTYAALAAAAGGVGRSVGGACGANPIPIVIPCHRVVAASGPGGYSGGEGLETKRLLLQLERRHAPAP